jgi:hypothetical protein
VQVGGVRAARSSAAGHRGVAFDGMDLHRFGQGQGEGADAGRRGRPRASAGRGRGGPRSGGRLRLRRWLAGRRRRGGRHWLGPSLRAGRSRRATVSLSQVRREKPWASTSRARSMRRAASRGLPPVTTTSGPPRVSVTCSESSIVRDPPAPPGLASPGKAAIRCGVQKLAVGDFGDGVRGAGVKAHQHAALGARADSVARRREFGGRGHHREEGGRQALPGQGVLDDLLLPVLPRKRRRRVATGSRRRRGRGGRGV